VFKGAGAVGRRVQAAVSMQSLAPHDFKSSAVPDLRCATRICCVAEIMQHQTHHAAAGVGPPRFDSQNQKIRPDSKTTLKDLFNGVRLFFSDFNFLFFQKKSARAASRAMRQPGAPGRLKRTGQNSKQ